MSLPTRKKGMRFSMKTGNGSKDIGAKDAHSDNSDWK